MKVVLLRGEPCPDRLSCPRVFVTDRGTHLVQGSVSAGAAEISGWATVEIPLRLIPEAAAHRHRDLRLTDHGSVVVRGVRVTDAEALAAIRPAAGEDVVELAENVLPALEVSR